jgi:hypothetical protein
MKLLYKIGIGFLAVSALGACLPDSKTTTATASKPDIEHVAQVSRPRINANLTTYQGQLMTDYEVGKVLGDIKCGKRPVGDGIDFLNVNGVPKALLENQTPELREGYRIATAWC